MIKDPFHRYFGRYFFFPEYRQACDQLRDNLDRLIEADFVARHRSGFGWNVPEERKDIYDWHVSRDIDLLFECSPILAETLDFFDVTPALWFINKLNKKEMDMTTTEYSNTRPHVDYTASILKTSGFNYHDVGDSDFKFNPCKISLNLPITPMKGLQLETFEAKGYEAPFLPDRIVNAQAPEIAVTKIPEKILKRKRILDANDPILLNSWQPHRLTINEKYWDTVEEECLRMIIRFAPKYVTDIQDWDQFLSDPWDLFQTPFDISWKYWEAKCTR